MKLVVAAWILLVLAIMFLLNTKFQQDAAGVTLLIFLFILTFFSATIIWEDIHSFEELKHLF